jgi:RNA polymerase sigma-70 factor (ECF subfamily)
MLQAEQDALVLLAQNGNKQALALLFEELHPGLIRFAYKICADKQLAFDIAQEGWLKSVKALERLNDPRVFKSWLFRSVRWAALDLLRKQKIDERVKQDYALNMQLDEQSEADEIGMPLTDMLADLPKDEKQAMYLFYQEDMRLSEIAIVQDVPLSTVKTRLFRAKKKIKTRLEKQDEYR